jgi:hypothetical protein
VGPELSTNESDFAVEPYAGNTEPKLWFQKLVIRRGGKRQDRAITFTRGLNIIWSERKVGDDRSLNAGNTSLTRLLRYCLGEDHFGTGVHERRVQANFPQGAVAAHLRLAKTDWWIVRSLSDPSQRIAVRSEVLENPWAEVFRPKDESFNEFLKSIHDVFKPAIQAHNASEVAMGFIARDHEGGFDSVFRWRAAHKNSRQNIREELRVWALCALLGFRVWTDRVAPEASHPGKTADSTAAPHLPEDLLPEIAERLGITAGRTASTRTLLAQAEKNEAAAASALEAAQERLRQLVELEKLQAELAHLDGKLEAVDRLQKAKSKHKLRGDKKCGLVKQRASKLIEDDECLLRKAGCYIKPDAEAISLCDEMKNIGKEKSQAQKRITSLKGKIGEVSAAQVQMVIGTQQNAVDQCRAALLKAHGVSQTLKNLSEPAKPSSSVSESAKPSPCDEGQCSEGQCDKGPQTTEQSTEPTKEESDRNFAEFVDTYRRVVVQLISPTAAKALNAHLGGIHDLLEEDQLGSKESLMRLWTFDMAALLRSIESPLPLPGLLIHDSPKQEDLADEQYWGLFRFARLLEQKDQDSARFQYIITTSTPPPDDLRDGDHVRLHLAPGRNTHINPDTGEEEDDGYLFKSRF